MRPSHAAFASFLLALPLLACSEDGTDPDVGPEGSYDLEPALVIACSGDVLETTVDVTGFDVVSATDDALEVSLVVEFDHAVMGPVDQENSYTLAYNADDGSFSGAGPLDLVANDGVWNSVFLDSDVTIEGQFTDDDSFDAHISGIGDIGVVNNDAYIEADCSIDQDFTGTLE